MDKVNVTPTTRDALEAAIRLYGHPSAIADLDSFSKESVTRRVFLDAAFNMCRDTIIASVQDLIRQNYNGSGSSAQYDPFRDEAKADAKCPLVRALHHYGLQTEMIPEVAVSRVRTWLGTFGRPVPPKSTMLYEHEMRVRCNRQMEASSKAANQVDMITTSKNVTKEQLISHKFEWDKLKPVSINDLKLFDSNKGAYLEGKLLVDPFTPMVGCTTIMEDRNGDVLLIALYNFLPDGVSGSDADPIASAKIPKGCTLRIAEPFLKVFKDGSRGIRIDNPTDITVVLQNQAGGRDQTLEKAKASGNLLFQKKMYLAAIDSYINGLRKADFVPTLLSNRSQAFMMVKDWNNAFADAAASLTIRPGCKKTWGRYRKALGRLEQVLNVDNPEGLDGVRNLLKTVLLSRADANINIDVNNAEDADTLKSKGNAAFKTGDYEKAIQMYSVALASAGKTCRAVLSNWSQCCLNIGGYNDSIAGAAASLRIAFDEKALYRLCKALVLLAEPAISLGLIQNAPPSFKHRKNSTIDELSDAAHVMVSGDIRIPTTALSIPAGLLPYWHGDIETFEAGRKGRGVRAKVEMNVGQLVIIEHPVAFSEENIEEDKKVLMSIDEKNVNDTTQNLISETIIYRSQREGLLTNIVDNLYDGANAKPLVPFNELIPSISSTSPLLPSHHEYMEEERIILTPRQVQGLVKTNSHGNAYEKKGSWTNLYPAISMFNHSKNPTCEFILCGNDENVSILVTSRPVKASEELTVCYHEDEAKAKASWGLE